MHVTQRFCGISFRYAARRRTRQIASASIQTTAKLACSKSQALPEEPHCWRAASRWRATLVDEAGESTIPVLPIQSGEESVLKAHGPMAVALAALTKPVFQAKAGETLLLPNAEGKLERVLLGLGSDARSSTSSECWSWAALPARLPAGTYRLQLPEDTSPDRAEQACLGWALGCYSFDRYKKTEDADGKPVPPRVLGQLVWPAGVDRERVGAMADAFFWSRDLINTPCEDLGPGHMCQEAAAMAQGHEGANCNIITGDELLTEGYPTVHTVGRACSRPPALIDIRWAPTGSSDALPRLTLVGKGVCFDSGGLDIKTAAGMKNMKRDMGGAALVLALGHVIMQAGLPVRLRVMVPTVENSISGNAYRPLDVLRTRSGITVENGNTDAEGRLILCDALYEASTEVPDLLIDAATLTGAARVALGADLPAVFTNCDTTWQQIAAAADTQADPVWRLPLHAGYRKLLDSKVADLSSTGAEGAPGSVIAALYLSEFVKKAPHWVHIDTGAAIVSASSGPGRPEGGEPLALRTLWAMVKARYEAAVPQAATT